MGMDKVEDFFQSVERLKQAAAPKPEEEPTQYDPSQDPAWLSHQLAERERAMQALQQQLLPSVRNVGNSSGTSTGLDWERSVNWKTWKAVTK